MIGVIADDFTGGTDVAAAFRRAGLQTAIVFGEPGEGAIGGTDVVVVALKSRSMRADHAVRSSLNAAGWLQSCGAEQLYFKYCSTFDSTPDGNIGPVADALADHVGARLSVVVPASPSHGRTQYLGHLFVHEELLSESSMQHHPLTPMTNSRIAEVLSLQTRRSLALVPLPLVRQGPVALRRELRRLEECGTRYAVVDATEPADLAAIAAAAVTDSLLTGAAGLAHAFALVRGSRGSPAMDAGTSPPGGPAAILSGSCSGRTLAQIASWSRDAPSFLVSAETSQDPQELAQRALCFYDALPPGTTPLFYSSLPPEKLRTAQNSLGVDAAARLVESTLGLIARGLVARGIRRLVVAGGETSGAVLQALEIRGARVGLEAAPGVPWIHTDGEDSLSLLLKSGNFGDDDFFSSSLRGDES